MSLLLANRAIDKVDSVSPFPPVIEDGNTVAWYLSDDLTTITKDGSDFMSEWRDYLGSGHDSLQALGSSQPKWFLNDGVLFDGIDDFMKTLAFTFEQPEMIYIVFKHTTLASSGYIFDGNTSNTGFLRKQTAGGQVSAYAGNFIGSVDAPASAFMIVTVLFNGVSSELLVNNIGILGNSGSANMGGFELGSRGGSNQSHIQVKEILLRNIVDTPTDEQDIYDYLALKYSI